MIWTLWFYELSLGQGTRFRLNCWQHKTPRMKLNLCFDTHTYYNQTRSLDNLQSINAPSCRPHDGLAVLADTILFTSTIDQSSLDASKSGQPKYTVTLWAAIVWGDLILGWVCARQLHLDPLRMIVNWDISFSPDDGHIIVYQLSVRFGVFPLTFVPNRKVSDVRSNCFGLYSPWRLLSSPFDWAILPMGYFRLLLTAQQLKFLLTDRRYVLSVYLLEL